MLNVTLYTRKDCHLCEEVKKELQGLQEQYPHRVAEVDIDSEPEFHDEFFDKIPVVEVGPYRLLAPITRQNLQMTLGAAQDRRNHMSQIGGDAFERRVQRGQTFSTGDRISFFIARHYLAALNIFMLIYVGLPFLAPTLMKAGSTNAAAVIYKVYSPLCHQFGFRSFYLFGEQAFYPLAEANISSEKTFEQVTGFQDLANPYAYSRLQARQYVGDENVGYKVALCERDVAIYGALFFFGIFFWATGRRLPTLHWAIWLLIGIGPIGLDGFSQLFSQFNWGWLSPILAYRESTPFLRVLTGSLFGAATAWFAYPNVEETMREARQVFLKKAAVVKALEK